MTRTANVWALVVVLVWAAVVLPYIAVGPDDFEEYFTSVTTTKLAMDAMRHGAWPFWTLDLGLGMPQPLRFHFITHPLAPLCGPIECHALLRAIASLHLLLAAAFMGLLALRFTGRPLLAAAAALTYCVSSSVIQPMFRDDWPITAINESALPVMLYAILEIGEARDRRDALLWSLVLGGLAGLLVSMSLPVWMLVILTLVSLSAPGWRQRFPWLVLAGAITLAIGAAQLHHIYEEFVRTPPGVARTDHRDFAVAAHLWSTFLRPLPWGDPNNPGWWRTIFIGPVFATLGALGAVGFRDPSTRPLRVGVLLGFIGFATPPAWLFNINTAQWTFRTHLNVFGILLAVIAVHRWLASRSPMAARLLVLAHLCWVAFAFLPMWYPTYGAALGTEPTGRRRLVSPGLAEEIAAMHARKPGRVIFAEKAYEALRLPVLNAAGLAPNQLAVLGVPTVTGVAFGISTDDLSPIGGMLEGEIRGEAATVRSRALLDVLGIRYVVVLGDEEVAPGLREVKRLASDVRVYENSSAWPEAFFVEEAPRSRLPRLTGCAHDRFLCADFSQAGIRRVPDRVEVTRLADGMRLSFAAAESMRDLVVTQWYRDAWSITAGRGSIFRAAEQLVGIQVEPGETTVTVQYRPRLRALLLAVGVTTELTVALGIVALAARRLSHHA